MRQKTSQFKKNIVFNLIFRCKLKVFVACGGIKKKTKSKRLLLVAYQRKLKTRHDKTTSQDRPYLEYRGYAIEAWFCSCSAGARVVGMCSHCAAVSWYLSYARHQSKDWCANQKLDRPRGRRAKRRT